MDGQTDNKCNLPAEFEATTVYQNKVSRKSVPTKYDVFEKLDKTT